MKCRAGIEHRPDRWKPAMPATTKSSSFIDKGLALHFRGMDIVVLNTVRVLAAITCTALVAGCNSSNGLDALQVGQSGESGETRQARVDEQTGARIVQGIVRELPCATDRLHPRIRAGGENDPEKIVYQAAIADTTRQCSVTGDQMTINVVVAGRRRPGRPANPGRSRCRCGWLWSKTGPTRCSIPN